MEMNTAETAAMPMTMTSEFPGRCGRLRRLTAAMAPVWATRFMSALSYQPFHINPSISTMGQRARNGQPIQLPGRQRDARDRERDGERQHGRRDLPRDVDRARDFPHERRRERRQAEPHDRRDQ